MVLSRNVAARRRPLARLAGVVAVAPAALVACGGDDADADADQPASAGPTLVATTGIWADVTAMVACDGAAEVRALVPPGADPHAYELSLRDRETLDDAALVVANGLGLEEPLADTLADVEADGVTVFRVAEQTTTAAGGPDPHVWFDPLRVRDVLPALGDAVVEAGADRPVIERCVAAAQQELADLDIDLREILGAVPEDRRTLVTNHDSLGLLAERYGFEVLGSVVPSTSTLAQASPAELDDLARAIERAHVPAIFTEQLQATADADALADRLGVDLVALYTDTLGEDEATTYPDLLRYDARAIASALGG